MSDSGLHQCCPFVAQQSEAGLHLGPAASQHGVLATLSRRDGAQGCLLPTGGVSPPGSLPASERIIRSRFGLSKSQKVTLAWSLHRQVNVGSLAQLSGSPSCLCCCSLRLPAPHENFGDVTLNKCIGRSALVSSPRRSIGFLFPR